MLKQVLRWLFPWGERYAGDYGDRLTGWVEPSGSVHDDWSKWATWQDMFLGWLALLGAVVGIGLILAVFVSIVLLF